MPSERLSQSRCSSGAKYPRIHTGLQSAAIPIAGVQLPWLVVAAAGSYTLFVRILKLHDRISDAFQIRRSFDVFHILLPLALGAGVSLDPLQVETVIQKRPQLMRAAFYAYATSTNPQIDRHEITMALDQWSWYWACLEGAFAAGVGAIVFATQAGFRTAFILSVVIAALLTVSRPLYSSCTRHALSQVEAILTDPVRTAAIAREFRAI